MKRAAAGQGSLRAPRARAMVSLHDARPVGGRARTGALLGLLGHLLPAPADRSQARSGSVNRTTLALLFRQRGSVASLIVLALFALLALAAPVLGMQGPLIQDRTAVFHPPTLMHLFGTDELGRDIFSRVVYGGRVSLLTAGGVVLIASVAGIPAGLIAGYFGGWIDGVVMRFVDFLLAVPAILLAMVILAVLGPGSFNALLAVAIVSVPAFARLARASTLTLKERDFVLATRSVGAGDGYLIFRAILPNAVSPLVVQMAVSAAYAILLEATLSFLGLGTRPPEPSWGAMLGTGRSFLHHAPWYGLFPGIVLTTVVLSLNGLADGLQGALSRTEEGHRAREAA